jgi:hypothetical protein
MLTVGPWTVQQVRRRLEELPAPAIQVKDRSNSKHAFFEDFSDNKDVSLNLKELSA